MGEQAFDNAGAQRGAPRSFYFAIFAVSGFSGLIYESIWSQYLKLYLGHAAYAQSLVLIIFMGGMALGSWFASRRSSRSRFPLLMYAAVELIVGIAALLFHGVFTGLTDIVYQTVLPSVGVPAIGATVKWLSASALILPQSILLGMTFPLMSAGIVRRYPDTPGSSIAMLYFTNSIGAALGVLASGFWLVQWIGLPGTIVAAGMINIALAVVVWLLVRVDPERETAALEVAADDGSNESLKHLFLLAAFITGAASFIYEISWIRMLSLVLGATTHSFELMLSAFITGLAFGGLWIKRRIDRIDSILGFSGYVQLIMGLLALMTIPVYLLTFDWMAWLLQALGKTDAGYSAYSAVSHSIALAVMLPTTFMAGMTLPLFTVALVKRGCGEASIGQVYAANTVGAIVGVLFAVHVGLPMLGLKGAIVFAAILDIGLGLLFLAKSQPGQQLRAAVPAGVGISLAAVVATVFFVEIDKRLLISGVFRTGQTSAVNGAEVVYYRDGKTASVSLEARPNGLVILSTNGKPDASIQFNPNAEHTMDEVTQVLGGAMPIAFKPDAQTAAVVGIGSGLSTHVLLGHEGLQRVDTVEIEPAMVAAASGFGAAVDRVFSDPRSNIQIEDAKTYFSLQNSTYDLIITEPSNPWVSGVASLFSSEFYSTAKRHLADDGVFVQWIQLYEFNDQLVESVMKALAENFANFEIYSTDGGNVLFVASDAAHFPKPDWSVLLDSRLAPELAKLNVNSAADLNARFIIDRDNLMPYLASSPTPMNSDYYPFVDLHAAQARYKKSTSDLFRSWAAAPLPVVEILHDRQIDFANASPAPFLIQMANHQMATALYQRIVTGSESDVYGSAGASLLPETMYLTELLLSQMNACDADSQWAGLELVSHDLMTKTLAFLPAADGLALVDHIAESSCGLSASARVHQWFSLYRAVATRDASTIASTAEALMNDPETARGYRSYLLTAAMLGNVAADRYESAMNLWRRYGEQTYANGRLPTHADLVLRIAVAGRGPVSGSMTAANRR